MNRTISLRAAVLVALCGSVISPAFADDAAVQAQIEALRASIDDAYLSAEDL